MRLMRTAAVLWHLTTAYALVAPPRTKLLAPRVRYLLAETIRSEAAGTGVAETLARWGGTIFSSGLLMAIPIVTALLLINLSLGILNRASPQLSIFSVGFPMTLTAGLVLITALIPDMGGFWSDLFEQQLRFMQGMIEQMAGTP